MELFERWAYYGMFTVLSVYLTDPKSSGGLGFTQEQRGLMQAVATGILYLFPILGGAIADRFGYRKVLLAAFVTLASGYFAMGNFSSYGLVFISFLIVAVGGAIFKPIIVATVSRTAKKGSDTLGFGIFYMIVNIGGFIGPFVASKLRDLNWLYVFYMCTAVIIINLILLIFYREPAAETARIKEPLGKSIRRVFSNTVLVLSDKKFVIFLIIIAGFWTMYMQIFFTLPVYITQWIDTGVIYESSGFLARIIGTSEAGRGVIRPEMILNIPAFTIICFQVLVSSALTRVKPVLSMVAGILVVAFGMIQFVYTLNGWYVVAGVVVIAFGEMASSPRIQEYIGRIAPREKVALYMGYSFLPVAGGNILGGLLSGKLYALFSDKYAVIRDYLTTRSQINPEVILNAGQAELLMLAEEETGLRAGSLDQYFYEMYNPGVIWIVFASIGIVTAISLFFYNRKYLSKIEKPQEKSEDH